MIAAEVPTGAVACKIGHASIEITSMGRDIGDAKVIGVIHRLLGLFDEVEIVHVRYRPSGDASIVLRTACQESLAGLAGCAENANFGFLVWSDHEDGKRLPGRIQYELRTGPEPMGAEYSAVEHLCSCMAHKLVACGRLEQEEADQILAAAWADDD